MFIYAAVGIWALTFGLKTYSRPEMMHDRWLQGSLPRRKWVLRAMAAVWVFIGFIALGSALICLPMIRVAPGGTLLRTALLISLVGTVFVLVVTPRHDSRE